MRGRFLWVPIWGSFFLLVALVSKIPRRWLEGGALVALAAAVMPWSPVFDVDPKGGGSLDLENGIVHERAFYAEFTSLLSVLYRSDIIEKYELPVPPYESSIECAEHRGKGRSYAYRTQVGFCGYFGGPDLMVFDWTAVTDPFLARVPYIPREECRAGHLYRHNVDEYVRRRRGQLARFSDPGVEDAYQDVVLVTRGKLFSARRLGALARLTLGFHRDAFTRFEEAGEELPASLPTKKRVVGAPDE